MSLIGGSAAARTGAVAVLAAGALALSGCGADGVMHDGGVGASARGNSVSTDAVQRATNEIQALSNGNSRVAPADVIPFLVLAPQFDALGSRYGIGVSDHDVQQLVRGAKLSPETLTAFRSNVIAANSAKDGAPAGLRDDVAKLMDTPIDVNPRFGAVESGRPANAYADWLTYAPVDRAEAGLPGGHGD